MTREHEIDTRQPTPVTSPTKPNHFGNSDPDYLTPNKEVRTEFENTPAIEPQAGPVSPGSANDTPQKTPPRADKPSNNRAVEKKLPLALRRLLPINKPGRSEN